MMFKKISVIFLSFFVILSLSSCFDSKKETAMFITKSLNIATSGVPEVLMNSECRVGVQGDGEFIALISLSQEDRDSVFKQLDGIPGWTSGKFTQDNIETFFNDNTKLCGELGRLTFRPETEFDGWFFRDEFLSKNGKKADGAVVPNYTFAVFDKETGLLLFYRFDS